MWSNYALTNFEEEFMYFTCMSNTDYDENTGCNV